MPPRKTRQTKPRNFKAEYARRIANALKKGKTRQAARGHKSHEHIERWEREKEQNGGLTNDQIRSIHRWHERFGEPRRTLEKGMPNVEDVIDFARENGYNRFSLYRKIWDAQRRVYVREKATGKYESLGESHLQLLADMAEISSRGDGIKWLYYH
jgi:hypothetical protein